MIPERRIVYLTGLPACGKTTLGRALPGEMARLGLPPVSFTDLDEAIEAAAGMSVAEIFSTGGESRFRTLESHMLREVTESVGSSAAIACGGGTPCFGDNLSFMLGHGLVVELRATREATIRRLLEAPRGQRPLVSRVHGNPAALSAAIEELAERRAPWFSQAHAVFDSTRLENAEEIKATAEAFIRRFLTSPVIRQS